MEHKRTYPKTRTPWGPAQVATHYSPGIIWYSTAGHGGFHLSAKLNDQVPEYMRRAGGWYEEDEDWAIVATVFSQLFSEKERADAKTTFRNWQPEAYEKFYNVVLQPGESHVKDDREFRAAHQNDYLVLSAFGDHKDGVPKGMVGVFAGRGGRTEDWQYPKDTRWFLVTAEEYAAVRSDRFVINEGTHQEIPALS